MVGLIGGGVVAVPWSIGELQGRKEAFIDMLKIVVLHAIFSCLTSIIEYAFTW